MPFFPPFPRLRSVATFSVVLLMMVTMYNGVVPPPPAGIVRRLAPPRPGLATLAAPMRIGLFVNDFLLTQQNRPIENNRIERDFNSITVNGFFGNIHPCPPQLLVDSRLESYNLTIHDAARWMKRCEPYLDYRDPSAVAWETYEQEIEWNWQYTEAAIEWAHQRGIVVHFQTLFWDHPAGSVLPEWLQSDTLAFEALTDTQEIEALAEAFVLTMEDHANGVAQYLCQTPELAGAVYVYDVVNEVTNDDGSIRTWKFDPVANPHPYNWALVNEWRKNDPLYTGPDEAYYIYKAFEVADRAISSHCETQSPRPELLFNDKFPVNAIWDGSGDNPNRWAQGAYETITAINGIEPGLIDAVGIQAHLILQPTAQVPVNPVTGLRSILEAFADAGISAHITELDVAIRQADYHSFFDYREVADYFPQQALVYREVAHACLYADDTYQHYAPLCKGISTWGLYDRTSWLDCYHPLLFNEGEPLPPLPTNHFCPQPPQPELMGNHPAPTPTAWSPPTIPTSLVPKMAYHLLYKELETIPTP